jgi:hypothetical protein
MKDPLCRRRIELDLNHTASTDRTTPPKNRRAGAGVLQLAVEARRCIRIERRVSRERFIVDLPR